MDVRIEQTRLGGAQGRQLSTENSDTGQTSHKGRLHSPVLRWLILTLAVVAAGLFAASFFRPWWQMVLFAPQYPSGLRLEIALTGLAGDVREINMLNHYIGMEGLDKAAVVERAYAAYGVGLVGVMGLGLTLWVGRKLNWLVVLPGLLFPVGFIADSFFWMYKFGHSLDPRAPLRIPPFTPQLFGGGTIGQFYTWSGPTVGFWMAVAGVAALVVAVLLRRRVCSDCPLAATCGPTCDRKLVLPVRMDGVSKG